MDPNDTQTPPATDPPADEPSVGDALDKGIAEATPAEPAPVDTPAEGEPAPPVAEGEQPVPGTEEAAAAEAAKAAAAKPEPDAAVEKEIAELGLKEKGAARLRELSAEVKAAAPMREALEKVGVKSPEELNAFLQRNQAMTAVMDMMVDTGATNEQFTQTFDYLGLVHRANKGDRAAAQQAFEMVGREYAELAKALGKEIPGVHDPLAEHADLQADVEAGAITRERALELAEGRRIAALQGQARSQQQEEAQRAASQQQAIEGGRAALNDLERGLVAADPTYAAKREAFYARVREICRDFPPAQWAAAAKLAYDGIAAPAPAKPAPGPMRPGGPRPVIAPTTDDPMEALNFGIANAG